MAEELTKLRGVKCVHLRHLRGLEKDIEELFLNFVVGSEKHKVNLTGLKMSYLSSIEKIQQQNEKILESLKSEDFEEELFENLKQESDYNKTLAKIDLYLNKKPSVISAVENLSLSSSSNINENKVKLPKLELCKFNGDIIEWRGFWDQFKSTVHENENISPIEKFSYLRSLLEEKAFSAISGLTLSSENYNQAIEILKSRYGNEQVLISAYMQKFVDIPKVKNSNDVHGLRFLWHSVDTSVRNLQS